MAPVAAEASEAVTNEQASTDDTWVVLVGDGEVVSEDELELGDPPQAAAKTQAVTSATPAIQRRARGIK
ncbi:MAG: hypothetical protein E6I05_06410 [Chloroflexi bacterium]|nr:MAG: hypothetical protein E6I05_06410 [Chloroflexota bacterium]TMG44464.1 MAG: hypothetical protein E6H85_07215 [Chloroflexota bacterium]